MMPLHKREDIIRTGHHRFLWEHTEFFAEMRLNYLVDHIKGDMAEHLAWLDDQGIPRESYHAPSGVVYFIDEEPAMLFYLTWGK